MTFRYIGSKARLVDQIRPYIGRPTGGTFVDAFCGMGSVAELAASLGWPVRINDSLASATIAAGSRLISKHQAPFIEFGGYEAAVQQLNEAEPTQGLIWREYSPASAAFGGVERRYFSEVNAGRIDAVRQMIGLWSVQGRINAAEERLLIADLFGALNRVANIAGTFGCFLAKWTPQSRGLLELRCRQLKESSAAVETHVGDVFEVPNSRDDVVYLDPPYTKRQYASYYHILETVAFGDSPIVEGVAGLRPWKSRSSDFCYKVKALQTLIRLIESISAERVLLSYSSEGHIPLCALQDSLSDMGFVTFHAMGEVGRYRPNKAASDAGSEVSEYLIVIDKAVNSTLPRVRAELREEVFA